MQPSLTDHEILQQETEKYNVLAEEGRERGKTCRQMISVVYAAKNSERAQNFPAAFTKQKPGDGCIKCFCSFTKAIQN